MFVDAFGALHVCGATGCLAAFCARSLALGLGVLGAGAALVRLFGAVSGCGFDAFAEGIGCEAPHEAFAGVFIGGVVDFLEGLLWG
jgi:hypothetical protein